MQTLTATNEEEKERKAEGGGGERGRRICKETEKNRKGRGKWMAVGKLSVSQEPRGQIYRTKGLLRAGPCHRPKGRKGSGGKNEPTLMNLLHSLKTVLQIHLYSSNKYLPRITRLLWTGMSILKVNPKTGFEGKKGSHPTAPSFLHPGATQQVGSPGLKSW